MTDTPVPSDSHLRPLFTGAIRLAMLGVAVYLIESVASSTRLVALLGGVLAMEFVAGPLAIQWDETGAKFPTLLRRVALGFGLGTGLSVLAVVGPILLGAATVRVGSPELSAMGLALVVAFAQATRDELLFRGLPLKWLQGRMDDRFALPFVALLGTAPVLAFPDVTVPGVVLSLFSGLAFAFLWRLGRGMYLVWGVHAGWLFMLASGLRGSLLDVKVIDGALIPVQIAEGKSAWVAVVGVGVGTAIIVWLWTRRGVERRTGENAS